MLEFRRKIWAGDKFLGLGMQVVSKSMRLSVVSKGVRVDKVERNQILILDASGVQLEKMRRNTKEN